MRKTLTLALLLAAAPTAAFAIEKDGTDELDEALRAAPAAELAQPAGLAAPVDQVIVEKQNTERPAKAVQAQPPRNWLWTVAAIVAAGIILAVIL